MIEFEGERYARVSEILAPLKNFDPLITKIVERKCGIGTNVHEAIEDYLQGKFPACGAMGVGYFMSFEKWYLLVKPEVYESETRLYSDKYMLTGQIDALMSFEMKGSSPLLIDYKTCAMPCETWPLQFTLYHMLCEENQISISNRGFFLQLNKDGKMPKVHEYQINDSLKRKCLDLIDKYWKSYNLD